MPPTAVRRITITDVPARLRDKLNADIKRHTFYSMNDLVATVLSARYGVPHKRTKRRARTLVQGRIILKLSEELYERIRAHAFEARSTMAGICVFGLQQHYGLDPDNPGRKRDVRGDPNPTR